MNHSQTSSNTVSPRPQLGSQTSTFDSPIQTSIINTRIPNDGSDGDTSDTEQHNDTDTDSENQSIDQHEIYYRDTNEDFIKKFQIFVKTLDRKNLSLIQKFVSLL